ncbi:MAG: hypothetical protein ACXVZW_00930 [Gaiellaceae bacterium]
MSPAISGNPRQGDTMTATSGSWSGATPIVFSYQWRRCNLAGNACSVISGASGPSVVPSAEEVGHTLRVQVTAVNSDGQSSVLSARTQVIVARGAPLNSVLPKISGTTRQDDTLTASAGTWSGNDPIKFAYQWLRCNQAGESCASIAGAGAQTYTLAAADLGHTLRVRVTGTNSAGVASALSRPSSLVVAGEAPANTAPPAVSGTNVEGSTLSTSDGSWTGSGTFHFGYQWQRCDAAGTNCGFIAGASARTYLLTSADVGHLLRSAVTARNGLGRATAYSNATQQILPRVPTSTAQPTISGTPQAGTQLTATSGSWAGPGPISYFYQWARSNSKGGFDPIPGATQQTYTLTAADSGHLVFVQVKAQNSFGAGFANSKPVGPVSAPAAVAIHASLRTVTYGGATHLTGFTGAGSGSKVQVVAFQTGRTARVVTSTRARGSNWSVTVRPKANTIYRAQSGGGTSNGVRVLVRPRIRLGAVSSRAFSVRVYSVNQLAGRRAIVELRQGRHWRTIGLIRLRRTGLGSPPTIVSRTVFRVLVRSGARLRVMITARQAGPGYITGSSNIVRR